MTVMVETDLREAAVLDIDPFSEENIENPYNFHRSLREAGPFAYIPKYDMYAVGRYDEVRQCLVDYSRFLSSGGIGLSDIRKGGSWRPASPITEVDPPQHTSVRAAMTKLMSPIVIRQWKETFAKVAKEVVAEAVEKGQIDGVPDLVEAFVLRAFPDVLGVDVPSDHFLDFGELNFNQIGPNNHLTERSAARVAEIGDQYLKAFDRKAMLPGGFGEKIYEAEERGELEKGTAGPHVRGFLRAGVDTTIAGIGHTLHLLSQHPEEWKKVKDDPSKVKGAFDEAIRLYSPAQVMFRTTVDHEVELSGYRMKPNTKVGNFLGAANRDERKFKNPDVFDVDRETAGVHVALGAGHHICIGQMIARAEAECVFRELVTQARSLRLVGKPEYKLINTLRTLKSLPVLIEAA